ncbi:MAG: hypothetical protein K0Q79_1236 [Flavipsychrobacter sp.]|jgi:hypothetical protein|nr:hypothetical protein [Flavipsychrobacter sp.]
MKNLFAYIILYLFFQNPLLAQSWQWLAESDNPSMEFVAKKFAIDNNGNVFSTGYINPYSLPFMSSIGISSYGSHTVYNLNQKCQGVITKTSPSGIFEWALATKNSESYPLSIATGPSGEVYLLGIYRSDDIFYNKCTLGPYTIANPDFAKNGLMYFLAKIDAGGNVEWLTNIAAAHMSYSGQICLDGNGDIYVAATYNDSSITIGRNVLVNTSTAYGAADIFITKFSSLGYPLWAKTVGGEGNENITGIAATKNNDVYILGTFLSSSFSAGGYTVHRGCGNSGFLCKIDDNGNFVWLQHARANVCPGNVSFNNISVDANDNVYIIGDFSGTASISHHVLTAPIGNQDVFLVKYDSTGNPLWVVSPKGCLDDAGIAVASDSCNVWICGLMGVTNIFRLPDTGYIMDFDGFPLPTPPLSTDPIFIAEYDLQGSYMNSFALPYGGRDLKNILIAKSGNLTIGGSFANDSFIAGSYVIKKNDSKRKLVLANYVYSISNSTTFSQCDTISCFNQNTTLIAPGGYRSYVWSNGSIGMKIEVDSGLYWVQCLQTCPDSMFRVDTFYVHNHMLAGIKTTTELLEQPFAFPNPTSLNWALTLPNIGTNNFTVRIMNIYGHLVKMLENTTSIDAANLPDGIYYIEVVAENRHHIVKAVKGK